MNGSVHAQAGLSRVRTLSLIRTARRGREAFVSVSVFGSAGGPHRPFVARSLRSLAPRQAPRPLDAIRSETVGASVQAPEVQVLDGAADVPDPHPPRKAVQQREAALQQIQAAVQLPTFWALATRLIDRKHFQIKGCVAR